MPSLYLRPQPRRVIDAAPLANTPVKGRSADRRFRLPVETAARLDAEAAARGCDRATLIRVGVQLLLDSLEPHENA